MHARLAERRDLIQTERWATLAASIECASGKVERVLRTVDTIAARSLIERLGMLRRHLSGNDYSHEHLGAAVAMMSDVAGSLSQLVAELGLTPKPHEDRNGPP